MKFKVLSRREIEIFETTEKYVVISIHDPESNPVELFKDNPPEGILYLKFPDFDTEHEGYKYNHLLFDEYNAKDILKFVKYHEDSIDLIVCQCEAGISRSSAVAGALARIYNGDDSYFFKHGLPNMLVYGTILKEYYK